MPLDSNWAAGVAVDQSTGSHVRFAMRDGETNVPCRVSFDALRDLFAIDGVAFDPLDLFLGYRNEIEDAAAEKYDREGAEEGMIDLDDTDFV